MSKENLKKWEILLTRGIHDSIDLIPFPSYYPASHISDNLIYIDKSIINKIELFISNL